MRCVRHPEARLAAHRIATLGRIVSDFCPGERVLVMLDYALYLDHSGTDDGQPVVAMGGFASTAREWMKLSYEWKVMLAGPPSFRCFHTTDLLAWQGRIQGLVLGPARDCSEEGRRDCAPAYNVHGRCQCSKNGVV